MKTILIITALVLYFAVASFLFVYLSVSTDYDEETVAFRSLFWVLVVFGILVGGLVMLIENSSEALVSFIRKHR